MNDEQLIALMAAVIYAGTLAKEGPGDVQSAENRVMDGAVDSAEYILAAVETRSEKSFLERAVGVVGS